MDERGSSSGVSPVEIELPKGEPRVIAGRYRLLHRLSGGGQGEVHRAEDLINGEEVAVKLLPPLENRHLVRWRSEISALRVLQLPGVARLLDEGVDGDNVFLVMEMVRGKPFPGRSGRLTWDSIGDTVIALLEILARVHATGVVHRDLKPENVLVDEMGRPTVLDFGLSAGRAIGSGLDPDRTAVGTPAYAAPEQILGEPADPASDLYALGVMVYEALAGRLPQTGTVPDEIMVERLHGHPLLLRKLVPQVPPVVAEVIDGMLARETYLRPRSATDVLGRLRGEETGLVTVHELPRLGGDAVLRKLFAAADRGASVDLIGAPGTGRTRCLRELRARLLRAGRRVAWIAPEGEPLGALKRLGEWGEDAPTSLVAALERIEGQVRKLLVDGVLLLVDDWEGLDRWSAAVLRRCRAAGCIIATFKSEDPDTEHEGVTEVAHLQDLAEEELRALFAGPDRILHLREDGAHELWRRSRGNPARANEEVAAWVRAGLAQWVGNELAVDRHALDRLRGGLQVLPAERNLRDPDVPLNENLERHLAWLALVGPEATSGMLALLREQSAWMVEAEHLELEKAGAIRRLPGGRIEILVAPRHLEWWTGEERREVHRRIARAIEPGTTRRLLHLVTAGAFERVPGEACELARRLGDEGRLGAAGAALIEGLHAVRMNRDSKGELRIFQEWIQVALAEFTPRALDRLLYELSRAIVRSDEVRHLEQLVHAAVAVLETDGTRALAEVEAVRRFEALELERWRQALRVQAARRCSESREEEVLEDITKWARASPSTQVQASLAEWVGRLRYRQERYLEAAELQARAAQIAVRVSAKLSAMLNGASALLEACRFDETIELATRARELAASRRHPLFEVRAEWLLRAADYRAGATSTPDVELAEAARHVGVPDQEALVCLTEAAVAWRAGQLPLARRLANRTARCWTSAGKTWGGILARALALECGARPGDGEVEELAARAELCPLPNITGQSLCLLQRAGARPRKAWAQVAGALRLKIPHAHWRSRREVLSVSEVLGALQAEGPSA